MKKIINLMLTMMFLNMGLVTSGVFAGEIDALVDKLVQKEVITPGEGQQIITETEEKVRKELAQGKSVSIPAWVQSIKLKGDFRLRYQWQKRKAGAEERHRGRYRFRLGLLANPFDNVEVGAGLATGGTDPRSTNQTFQNTFETPDIRLDYAYARYSPFSWLDAYGGKFARKPVLWQPSDLLWDGDINPEGFSAVLTHNISQFNLFLNVGCWVLDEAADNPSDQFMWYGEPGFKLKLNEKESYLTAALTYYGFHNVRGGNLAHSSGTNTVDGGGNLIWDYNSINPCIELGLIEPLSSININIPFLAFFGEYISNPDPSADNQGYLGGVKVGHQKVKGWKTWQAQYTYRYLQRDAWLDTFPDSDAYSGDTNIQGHEAVVEIGLTPNISLGFDYYYTDLIQGASRPEQLVQLDVLCKF